MWMYTVNLGPYNNPQYATRLLGPSSDDPATYAEKVAPYGWTVLDYDVIGETVLPSASIPNEAIFATPAGFTPADYPGTSLEPATRMPGLVFGEPDDEEPATSLLLPIIGLYLAKVLLFG